MHEMLDRIQKAVVAETEKNASLAEQEWKRGAHGSSLSRFSATAVENLRPSASGIEVLVRYVTRASERFEIRNRLYQKLLEMLRDPGSATAERSPAGRTHNGSTGVRTPRVDTASRLPYFLNRCRAAAITVITTIMGQPCRRTAMA